ncbi:patatin-like phospholipase family protein [Actinopolymorpha alba]|uniref:patatin-like phospholipase family protein n=1 Tax=Actinopolymorpha alba TaxID=533267 RepID=UPI000374630B|nr:patatin-like phospholipase family protein [Actinopolymorpha alba]
MDEQYWSPDHPVLGVLRARRSRQDRTGSRGDQHKVGLAIQGGGMRGILSGAMLTALEDMGFRFSFDAVYGSSSGALNGAYFFGGDSWRHLPIYWDDLTTRRFIDFRRVLSGNVVDLAYAFDTVVDRLRPLDYDAVLGSSVPLHVAMTLVDELRTLTVSAFTSKDDLRSALRASAWLPVAVRGTTEFHGKRVIDGAILTVHPYRLALADGCTHILSLSTRAHRSTRIVPALTQLVTSWHLDRLRAGLGSAHARSVRDYRQDHLRLAAASRSSPNAPHILDIAPLPWMTRIRPLELSPGRLILAARAAYELMVCAVEQGDATALRSGDFRAIPRFTRVEGASVHGR